MEKMLGVLIIQTMVKTLCGDRFTMRKVTLHKEGCRLDEAYEAFQGFKKDNPDIKRPFAHWVATPVRIDQ